MPRRFVFVFLIFGLTIGGFLTWKYWPVSETSASLSQRAYVWQRIQNSPEVSTAIETVPDFIGGLLPLVAEVHFRNGSENPPEIIRPTLSVASLQNRAAADREENRDAAVIRIGTAAAETRWNPEACELLSNLAGEFLNSTSWAPHELQIDYDCPQKKRR